MITSISTGISFGSPAMPTADLAWRPLSPNTSTRRSEHPLITAGCWLNSGSLFTMPNRLDNAPDFIEVFELSLHTRDDIDSGQPRGFVTLLGCEVASDLAGGSRAVWTVRRSQTGEVQQISGSDPRHVVGNRRWSVRQLDTHLLKPCFDLGHVRLLYRTRREPFG